MRCEVRGAGEEGDTEKQRGTGPGRPLFAGLVAVFGSDAKLAAAGGGGERRGSSDSARPQGAGRRGKDNVDGRCRPPSGFDLIRSGEFVRSVPFSLVRPQAVIACVTAAAALVCLRNGNTVKANCNLRFLCLGSTLRERERAGGTSSSMTKDGWSGLWRYSNGTSDGSVIVRFQLANFQTEQSGAQTKKKGGQCLCIHQVVSIFRNLLGTKQALHQQFLNKI
jgi:hypothetical protein